MTGQEKQEITRREIRRRRQIARRIRRGFFQITFAIVICFIILSIYYGIQNQTGQLSGQTKGGNGNASPIEENSPSSSITASVPNSWAETLSGDDWALRLVNFQNPIPEDYSLSLTQLKNGQSIDSRCYPDLQAMMDDCRSAGLDPLICSSYRTAAKQQALFEAEVNKYLLKGYDRNAAEKEAARSVAPCGTSEHQLGLALDIVDTSNQRLEQEQENTPVQQWLMSNSWKYGFILRYPKEKSDITGIMYEPWHYRYVGKTAAKEIYEQQICLEEYLADR